MKRRTILTPYFLDQGLPGLETLAEPGWIGGAASSFPGRGLLHCYWPAGRIKPG